MATSIVNEAVAARVWSATQTQRVVITGFLNSNGLYGGYGMVAALQESFFNNSIRIYGTNPSTIDQTNIADGTYMEGDNYSQGARGRNSQIQVPRNIGAGGLSNASNRGDYVTNLPALAAYYQTGRPTNTAAYNPMYRPLNTVNGFVVSNGAMSNGMQIELSAIPSGVINPITNDCTWDFWYAAQTTAGGSWRPAVVYGVVPNTVAAVGSTITVTSGTPSTTMSVVTLATTASGSYNLRMRQNIHNSPVPSGEIFVGYFHAFETNTLQGVVVAPFWAVGGTSAYDYASLLNRTDSNKMTDQAIDHWIDVLARPAIAAGQDPFFCWFINEGANQSNESSTSITLGLSATSALAWADNVIYVISRVHARWIAKGFKSKNCVFALHADHPSSNSAVQTLLSAYSTTGFDKVIAQFPYNVFGFNGNNRYTPSELLNAGTGNYTWYATSGSTSISSIPVSTAGSCALSAATDTGVYSVGLYVHIRGSTSTPSIDGVYQITANDGGTLTISGTPQITGSGAVTANSTNGLRLVDYAHMAVAGLNGATTNRYNTYWDTLVTDWKNSSSVVGPGATTSIRSSAGFSGGMRS